MIVILHNIRSLHNVGSIFRTADAAGVEKIYLCGITPAPVDVFGRPRQQLTKVSLGAEKYVEWEKIKSTTRLIDKLKKEKYKILAIEQDKKSTPYYKLKIKNKGASTSGSTPKTNLLTSDVNRLVLILGAEIKGLPPSILKKCDKILEIPMLGKKESLNVSVAFGIVAFHLLNSYPSS